jgi:hypothetical protein
VPAPPNRRLVWIVRLVFYPVAIGLIALAWSQRHVEADRGRGPALSQLVGVGVRPGSLPFANLVDGRPVELHLPVSFRCSPDVGDVRADYTQRPGAADLVAGRLRLRTRGIETTWPSGWTGRTDLDVDARASATSLTGTVRARLKLDAGGRAATCASGAVPLRLSPPTSPLTGRTAQGELMSVSVEDGRVRLFLTTVWVSCVARRGGAPVTRPLIFAKTVTSPEGALPSRAPIAITALWRPKAGRDRKITMGPETTAAAYARDETAGVVKGRLTIRRDGHGGVLGRLDSWVALPGGGPAPDPDDEYCVTRPSGVRFALPAR